MAMRLRCSAKGWKALCAANSQATFGDIYINDAQDYAIRVKLQADWLSEGYMFEESERVARLRKLILQAYDRLSELPEIRGKSLSRCLDEVCDLLKDEAQAAT